MDPSFDLTLDNQQAVALFIVGLWVVTVIVYAGTVLWGIRDAVERGKKPWLVGLLIALFWWPAGLLLWLVFRPKRLA